MNKIKAILSKSKLDIEIINHKSDEHKNIIKYQYDEIKNIIISEYKDLRVFPEWIDKGKRKNFTA